jgi:hypothetical protein
MYKLIALLYDSDGVTIKQVPMDLYNTIVARYSGHEYDSFQLLFDDVASEDADAIELYEKLNKCENLELDGKINMY